jgi:serine/threonine protein phosphatase PrpC
VDDDMTGRPGPHPCLSCGHWVLEFDAFCEACGARVTPSSAVHVEESYPSVAAVCDRGRRRRRNEDAFAIAARADRVAAVVCDGVASTPDAGRAATLAAHSAMNVLRWGLDVPDLAPPLMRDVLVAAFDAARRAVAPLAREHPLDGGAPATTWVAALAVPGAIVVAAVGDSRAYWVPAGGSELLLSTDDARMGVTVAVGHPGDEGGAARRHRVITRWLGADDDGTPPRTRLLRPSTPGTVILCTDGLWQYFDRKGQLGQLVERSGGTSSGGCLGLARRLVDAALDAGGGDNATAAVLVSPPARPPGR